MDAASAPTGFLGAVRHLFQTALAIVANRIELVALEFQEEKARAFSLVAWGAFMVLAIFMVMISISFLLVVAFWDQALWVLLGLSLFYVGAVLVAAAMVRQRLKAPLFSETINQLKKDREWLISRK